MARIVSYSASATEAVAILEIENSSLTNSGQ